MSDLPSSPGSPFGPCDPSGPGSPGSPTHTHVHAYTKKYDDVFQMTICVLYHRTNTVGRQKQA